MNEVQSGLEGVVAFASEIAEPDRDGGALRYRGVDIEELVGTVPFEQVWGLLVDGTLAPGPAARRAASSCRSAAATRAATSRPRPRCSRPAPLIDICDDAGREDLARASALMLDFVAQSARGADLAPVRGTRDGSAATRFLTRWRGEADPRHARALDAYWTSAAEHGMNASTFTARVVASTGADVAAALSAAVGALSGPLHGGAPSRVLKMLDAVEREGDATAWVERALDARRAADGLRPPRLPRRGPARARAAAHRARTRLGPLRGRRGARGRGAGGAARAQARTACWPPTSSSGRRSCSTSPRSRRSCSRRCSCARARPAGRRTSSSRSARRG